MTTGPGVLQKGGGLLPSVSTCTDLPVLSALRAIFFLVVNVGSVCRLLPGLKRSQRQFCFGVFFYSQCAFFVLMCFVPTTDFLLFIFDVQS